MFFTQLGLLLNISIYVRSPCQNMGIWELMRRRSLDLLIRRYLTLSRRGNKDRAAGFIVAYDARRDQQKPSTICVNGFASYTSAFALSSARAVPPQRQHAAQPRPPGDA